MYATVFFPVTCSTQFLSFSLRFCVIWHVPNSRTNSYCISISTKSADIGGAQCFSAFLNMSWFLIRSQRNFHEWRKRYQCEIQCNLWAYTTLKLFKNTRLFIIKVSDHFSMGLHRNLKYCAHQFAVYSSYLWDIQTRLHSISSYEILQVKWKEASQNYCMKETLLYVALKP